MIVKKVFYARIIKNVSITEDVYSMTLEYPGVLCGQVAPGQFVNLYLNRKDLLLPRPISICRVKKGRNEKGLMEKGRDEEGRDEKGQIILVYRLVGAGTKELAGYPPGTFLQVSSPLGNGYDLSAFKQREPKAATAETKSALVVGGGIGIPPLLELTHRLTGMGISVHAVLGYREEPFLHEEFQKEGAKVHLATDSGKFGFRGTVLELLKRGEVAGEPVQGLMADAYFACGPVPMLRALTEYCADCGMEAQVSLEERMGCGFGACVGCNCKIKTSAGIVQRKVCKDGPVFWGREVIWGA